MDSHVSETLGAVGSTGFACSCCGRPDPQISPTTNSPAGQNTYTDSIPVTAELFTLCRYNNSTESYVLHAHTHKKQVLHHQKNNLTAKWLKRLKAHFNAPATTPRTSAHQNTLFCYKTRLIFLGCTCFWSTVWECLSNSESRVILSLQKSPRIKTKCCYNAIRLSSALKHLWLRARGGQFMLLLSKGSDQTFSGSKNLVQSTHPSISRAYIKPTESLLQPAKQFLM